MKPRKSVETARQLRDAVRQLVVSHAVMDATQRPCGAALSIPHAYALLELLQAPRGLTATELARRLSIDRTNVSRLVMRMERTGEVERRVDTRDGRAKTVALTARGVRLAEGVDRSSAEHFAALARALEQPDAVVHALRALVVAMDGQPSKQEQA